MLALTLVRDGGREKWHFATIKQLLKCQYDIENALRWNCCSFLRNNYAQYAKCVCDQLSAVWHSALCKQQQQHMAYAAAIYTLIYSHASLILSLLHEVRAWAASRGLLSWSDALGNEGRENNYNISGALHIKASWIIPIILRWPWESLKRIWNIICGNINIIAAYVLFYGMKA